MDILNLPLEELGNLFVSCIPIGFFIGCFPMFIGFSICGIISIFKKNLERRAWHGRSYYCFRNIFDNCF